MFKTSCTQFAICINRYHFVFIRITLLIQKTLSRKIKISNNLFIPNLWKDSSTVQQETSTDSLQTFNTLLQISSNLNQLYRYPCCCCSVAKDCSLPSSTVSRSLLKFMSIDSVMLFKLSHSLPSPPPFAFNHSQHQGLFH